ncbi:LIC_13387 family protein [Fibrella arboris]|uniref:LIC_13387 family protein n=1 Tax=Fibrella arboris TaxID=3242486 RepID=UPI00351F9C6D
MIAKYLWQTGSVMMMLLGSIHFYYTFFTNQFSSANEKLVADMKTSSPLLTQDITMWKAWIGFNGSHSSGVLFIGLLNFYLALRYFTVLQSDHFFFLFNIGTIGFYLWLAKQYWFAVPCTGLSITLVCFTISYLLTVATK